MSVVSSGQWLYLVGGSTCGDTPAATTRTVQVSCTKLSLTKSDFVKKGFGHGEPVW